jgi:hypothetical protein
MFDGGPLLFVDSGRGALGLSTNKCWKGAYCKDREEKNSFHGKLLEISVSGNARNQKADEAYIWRRLNCNPLLVGRSKAGVRISLPMQFKG